MSGGNGSRHAACTECRQRKVRCDGGQPCCQNCMRRGSTCVFTRNLGQEKEEMLNMINELSDRLSHAEQSLKSQNAPNHVPPPLLPPQDSLLNKFVPDADIDSQEFWGYTNGGDSGVLNETNVPLFSESQGFGTLCALQAPGTALIHSTELDSLGWPNLKATQPDICTTSIHNHDAVKEELSSHALSELYRSYFEQADSSCYLLDKTSFLSKVDVLAPGPELLSLKFIVLAHGTSTSPAYSYLQDQLYDTSRKYFETAETGKAFVTIAALQACILLAMYELKQLLFSRAWGRISRAMWMAEMFGLHKMDIESGSPRQRSSGFHLATASDSQELEERRRTFWSAFILSSFTSTSVGWNNYTQINYEDITTLLPTENRVDRYTLPFRATLYNTLRHSGVRKLSNFEGLILASALYSRCLRHADYALRENKADCPNYDFWMHHYHLSESVNQITPSSFVDTNLQTAMTESATLCMNIRLQAILICLHHAAVVRESKTFNSTGSFTLESETKCLKAAMQVTNMTRQMREQADFANNSSPYVLWSIYVAAQVYVRAFHATTSYGACRPITPMHTPTSPPRSPKLYANRWPSTSVSSNGSQRHSTGMSIDTYGAHSSNTSLSTTCNHVSSISPSRFDLLENIDCLFSTLSSLKMSNLIAGVFESQIYHELGGGRRLTDGRAVGHVEFPLDGKCLVNDLVTNGISDIYRLL
ncbi:hypothetical protein B0O99DRAFT_637738 [Bisporella sp. PMI_857]|nr:hypothetical protein B0O99DRAFT_637738 [Bisporella sp. PMI_857]